MVNGKGNIAASESVANCRTILALFPFLVKGNLPLAVLREMRRRNSDVTVAYCAETVHYVPDSADDFARDDRLVDFSKTRSDLQIDAIEQEIKQRDVHLILQIGASSMYRYLPFVKEKFPRIVIVDLLYNDKGHVVNHFLFEPAIDGVIVESEYMGRYVERSSAKANPNVRVVKSGVALEAFTPSFQTEERTGLVLGYLGRMSDEKNPLGFITLAEQIYEAFPDTVFPISGDGPLAAVVRERIDTSLARDAFRWHGYNKDLLAMLRQLDALVVPSLVDGRPVVIMEANACGVPVIAAPVGGIPEMIESGVNGYLFPATAVESILQILSLWRNDWLSLVRIKGSSRNYAERAFDGRNMLDTYERVFREFLGFARS
jgi:glycosyltransferase involved in cell wall biosynthesis